MFGLTKAQEAEMMEILISMKAMMEENLQSMRETNRSIVESISKQMDENHQSLKESFQSLKEDLSKKLDDCHNSTIESIDRTIEDSRKFGEELRREREQSREQSNPKIDDKQMEVEKVPEDKNMEQASPEPEDSGDKKIQITQDTEEVKICLLYTSRCV